ncbi:hypothetical protein [Streptomyces cacaoi]
MGSRTDQRGGLVRQEWGGLVRQEWGGLVRQEWPRGAGSGGGGKIA